MSARLRDGEDVLGDWYRAEYPTVHRLCLGFSGDAARADDLATDAMLHLIDNLDAWDPQRPWSAWRQRVVLNLVRDAARARGRREHHERLAAQRWHEREPSEPSARAEGGDLRALIERALGALPAREREVFVAVDLEGNTAIETAELLGISDSTVRAALSLARRRLREWLRPHVAGEGFRAEPTGGSA